MNEAVSQWLQMGGSSLGFVCRETGKEIGLNSVEIGLNSVKCCPLASGYCSK